MKIANVVFVVKVVADCFVLVRVYDDEELNRLLLAGSLAFNIQFCSMETGSISTD